MRTHQSTPPLLRLSSLIMAVLVVSFALAATPVFAEVPSWIKQNAGWWAEDQISEAEFLTGIAYLISTGAITIPVDETNNDSNTTEEAAAADAANTTDAATEDTVPAWIKQNAGWWSKDLISDDDFLNGIQYMIQVGLITVSVPNVSDSTDAYEMKQDVVLAELEAQLEECAKITKTYKRIDCEKPVRQAILMHDYKTNADVFAVGPINYYWFGLRSEGNNFEITSAGQALLSLRLFAENTDTEVQSLSCTSPALCSYDVWDGSTAFRYAGTDFTSGQIVLNPYSGREFNILFGPNVGYGGSQFLYDESKEYSLRINESFGSTMIPLDISR